MKYLKRIMMIVVSLVIVIGGISFSSLPVLAGKDNEAPYPPYFDGVLMGDVNSDKVVNAKDVATLRRYLAGGWDVTIAEAASDVNDDGIINAKDVATLRRYLAGGWNVTIDEAAADVNGDDTINAKDVATLRRYLAGGWGIELG